jgi:hypothetical protein
MTSARSHLPLTTALALVLAVTAIGEMFFVLPRYRRFLEGIGVEPSLPARLAVLVSRAGLLCVAAALGGVVVAVVSERRGRSGVLSAYLVALSLVAAIYIAFTVWAFTDVLRLMDRIQ